MSSELLERLKSDEMLCSFLDDSFDETVFATSVMCCDGPKVDRVLGDQSLRTTLQKLGVAIGETEQSIGRLVSENQTSLLDTIKGTIDMKRVISPFSQELHEIHHQLSHEIALLSTPHESIGQKMVTLERLQEAIQYLRCSSRILSSLKKLGGLPADGSLLSGRELLKSSLALQEIQQSTQEVDLGGLRVLERALTQYQSSRTQIEEQSDRFFEESLQSQFQVNIATAIQVYHNLGILSARLQRFMQRGCEGVEQQLHQLFSSPLEQYWKQFLRMMEALYTVCFQATNVHKILLKRRDTITKKSLLDTLPFPFIQHFSSKLEESLTAFQKSPPAVHQKTVVEYPRILEAIDSLFNRLVHTGSNVTSSYSFWKKETFQRPFEEFETQYKRLSSKQNPPS